MQHNSVLFNKFIFRETISSNVYFHAEIIKLKNWGDEAAAPPVLRNGGARELVM